MSIHSDPVASQLVVPKFIIASVPKSGTTYIYTYFQKHSQFLASKVKEPRFLRP